MTCFYASEDECTCDCPVHSMHIHEDTGFKPARKCKLSVLEREQAVREHRAAREAADKVYTETVAQAAEDHGAHLVAAVIRETSTVERKVADTSFIETVEEYVKTISTPWGNRYMRQARPDNAYELNRQFMDKERLDKLLTERPDGYDARMRVQPTHGTTDYIPTPPAPPTLGIFGDVMGKKISNAILKCGPAFTTDDPDKDVRINLYPPETKDEPSLE